MTHDQTKRFFGFRPAIQLVSVDKNSNSPAGLDDTQSKAAGWRRRPSYTHPRLSTRFVGSFEKQSLYAPRSQLPTAPRFGSTTALGNT